MNTLWSKLKELDKRLPSSSIGTLVSVLFGLISLFVAIWYQRKPQLNYEILSQWPVYSICEDIPDLVITFKGQNIREQQQTLSVITIRISNPGSESIPLTAFDQRDLPGFLVTEGKIIKLDPIEKSKKLANTLELTRTAENSYVINPLILDHDQFFVIKLLILSPESSHPQVQSFGNVAGVDDITVVQAPPPEEHQSLFFLAFNANWPLQLLRALGYTIATLFLTILIIIGVNGFFTRVRRIHRRRLVRKFRGMLGHEPTKKEQAILDRYVAFGESSVVRLNAAFADRESLQTKVQNYLASIDPNKPQEPPPFEIPEDLVPPQFRSWYRFIPMLIEQKIIMLKDDIVTVDEQTVKTLALFESFLLAHEPERIRTAKEPLGSDIRPIADLSSVPATQQPDNE